MSSTSVKSPLRATTDFEEPESPWADSAEAYRIRSGKICPICRDKIICDRSKTCHRCAMELRSRRNRVCSTMVKILAVGDAARDEASARRRVRAQLARRGLIGKG